MFKCLKFFSLLLNKFVDETKVIENSQHWCCVNNWINNRIFIKQKQGLQTWTQKI